MCRVAVFSHEQPDILVIVALIQTEMLRSAVRRPRAFDRRAVDRVLHQALVMGVGTADTNTDRCAPTVGQQRPLRATFGPIGGVFASLLAAKRRLGHGTVERLPTPLNAAGR